MAIVDLPLVLPPSVAGLALLLVLGRRGLIGGALDAAGMEIPFTTLAVILAQTFVSAPFFVRSAGMRHRASARSISAHVMPPTSARRWPVSMSS